MEKTVVKAHAAPKFVQEFVSKTAAEHFAEMHGGKMRAHYEYDEFSHAIIKTYIVKY